MSSGWVSGLVALAACAACGRIGFGAVSGDGGGNGDDGGGGSGSGSGSDLSGTCVSPGYGDGFDETIPCKAFGTFMATNGTMNVMASELTITPTPSTNANLGCIRTGAAFGPAGTFVEISQVLSQGQTLMTVTGATSFLASFVVMNGTLTYADSASGLKMLPYDPTAMRWWRVRPDNGKIVGETSPDGHAWTALSSASGMVAASVDISVYVQTDTTSTAPGSAVIQGIDVCPP